MDSALQLKILVDANHIKDYDQACAYLEQSELVQQLSSNFEFTHLNCIHRLIQLAEIPFAGQLSVTRRIMEWVNEHQAIDEGFSWTGKREDVLSCYMALFVSSYIKLGEVGNPLIEKGIDWILAYQNFRRGDSCKWDGKSIMKYGGCLKSVPCYMGVVKTAKALALFKKYSNGRSTFPQLNEKLHEATDYILSHNLFQRLSDGSPITREIVKLFYPYNYKTNVLEILELMKLTGNDSHHACLYAKELIRKKRRKDGHYHQNSVYINSSWIPFDKKGKPAAWMEYQIKQLIDE